MVNAISQVVLVLLPNLRREDVSGERMPRLAALAGEGERGTLVPTFPCVTSPVQASLTTGVGPREHGVIANGFYDRRARAVEMWVGRNDRVQAPQVWDRLVARRPDSVTAVWHLQNIKDAGATLIVTPAPIHHPDGRTELWCYSKPESLYPELLERFGHFPLMHYWGPLAGIESSRWTVEAALWVAERYRPHLHIVYLPHLDYAAQKHGPDSPQALAAMGELDALLGEFIERHEAATGGAPTVWLVAGEYAITEVRGAAYPNRLLREAGLLRVVEREGHEHLDLQNSSAFAMVDHQLAHVYVHGIEPKQVAEVFRGAEGVGEVLCGAERAEAGIDHPEAGEVVLLNEADRWFAYYWWLEDAAAPPFARTVDIHSKPGYDPVELFIEPATKSIPVDASLVRGSHGLPAETPERQTAWVCSRRGLMPEERMRDTDIAGILLTALGANG